MVRRVKLKEVRRVDLEVDAWLLEWAMNPTWGLEEFGAYWLICLAIYNGGGAVEFDIERLAILCRSNPTTFVNTWNRIKSKFTLSGGKVFQKRVQNELKAARRRMQNAVNAGVMGANKRWHSHSDAIAKRITKLNENKTNTNTSNTKARALSLSDSVRFADQLEKTIKPKSKSDRRALLNLCNWLMLEVKEEHYDNGIFERVLNIAKDSKGRNPMAVLFSRLDKEIGYRARVAKEKQK